MKRFSKVFLTAVAGAALVRAHQRQQVRMDFTGKSVIITGGSRGLGLELARIFLAEGARLTLLARDVDSLNSARQLLSEGGGDVRTYSCDVGKQDQVRKAVRYVIEQRGGVDVLINLAGIIQVGPLEEMTLDDFEHAMAVHAWGSLYLIQEVVPFMKRQGGGRIVNVASIGGLVAVPHLLPYVMSKFAQVGLSDGMRAELHRHGIRVTTVCPGLMRTGSHVNAWFKGKSELEYAWFAAAAGAPLISINAERAARQIVNACRYGEARLTISLPAKVLHSFDSLFPGLSATFLNLAASLLPKPVDRGGTEPRKGIDLRSGIPSWLTYRADKEVTRNNEGPVLQ